MVVVHPYHGGGGDVDDLTGTEQGGDRKQGEARSSDASPLKYEEEFGLVEPSLGLWPLANSVRLSCGPNWDEEHASWRGSPPAPSAKLSLANCSAGGIRTFSR